MVSSILVLTTIRIETVAPVRLSSLFNPPSCRVVRVYPSFPMTSNCPLRAIECGLMT
jgi:hypothetical protein